jgi:uncharacterized protein YegL
MIDNNAQININPRALLDSTDSLISLQISLDISDSMNQGVPKRINILNKALAELPGTIKNSKGKFLVSLTTFGNEKAKIIQGFKNPSELTIPTLTANGDTPLGMAVDLQINMFEKLKDSAQMYGTSLCRPVFVFLTDGEPNDDWIPASKRLLEYQKPGASGKPRVVVLFGVIEGCSTNIVSHFVSKPNEQIVPLSVNHIGDFLHLTSVRSAEMSQLGSTAQMQKQVKNLININQAAAIDNNSDDKPLPPRKHVRGSQRGNFSPEEQRELLITDEFLAEDIMGE